MRPRRSQEDDLRLPLHDLHVRHPGITAGISAAYYEAAQVCLDRHHRPPVEFAIERGPAPSQVLATWAPPDERTKSAWANDIDATEAAACCLALAAIEVSEGLVAIGRAERLSGADYYLGKPGPVAGDLEVSFRLEVSGIDRGGMMAVKSRLRRKLLQASQGISNIPAIASVVGFLARTIVSEKVELR